MSVTATDRRTLTAWLLPTAAALASLGLGQFVSWLSPLLIALVVGAVAANAAGAGLQRHLDAITASGIGTLMLRWGILLIGFRLSVDHLVAIGLRGVLIAVATVAITLMTTRWIGRRLGLDDGLAHLIAAGVSICGAAAIATVQDGVRASQRHVAVALAMVTVLGTAWIGVIPLLADLMGLSDLDAGIWAGASIHEVAHVVAAGSLIGPAALAVAVSVKLTRVMLLAPVHGMAVRSARRPGDDAVPIVPWFVAGFLGAVAVRSTGVLPAPALTGLDTAANFLLAGAMACLGLGIVARALWPLPWRAVVVALIGTATVTVVPLALVLLT